MTSIDWLEAILYEGRCLPHNTDEADGADEVDSEWATDWNGLADWLQERGEDGAVIFLARDIGGMKYRPTRRTWWDASTTNGVADPKADLPQWVFCRLKGGYCGNSLIRDTGGHIVLARWYATIEDTWAAVLRAIL